MDNEFQNITNKLLAFNTQEVTVHCRTKRSVHI